MFNRFIKTEGFIRIPMTANRFSMSLESVIIDENKNIVKQFIDENDDNVVYGNFYNGLKNYKVGLLSALTFKNQFIHISYWDKLDIHYIDGNKRNTHPSNLIWKFPNGGLEHRFYKGFNIIPGFSKYIISNEGVVIYSPTGKVRSNVVNKKGYVRVCVTPDVGSYSMQYVHRLVALAWLDFKPNVMLLEVNHKNGIKKDNSPGNLEWVTSKRNNDHSYEIGLRTDTCPILVRNVISGDIKEYRSYNYYAKEKSLSFETVRERANNKKQPVWDDFTQIKRKDDPSPWREITDIDKEFVNRTYDKPIKAYNVFTKKEYSFSSITEASKKLEINRRSISNKLSKYVRNIPLEGYHFCYSNVIKEWPVHTEEELDRFKNGKAYQRLVKLTGLNTNETFKFYSLKDASAFLEISSSDLQKHWYKKKLVRNFSVEIF